MAFPRETIEAHNANVREPFATYVVEIVLHLRIHWEREPQTSSRILHRYNVLRVDFPS